MTGDDNKNFLLHIAEEVDKWVAEPAAMTRFREQFRTFCELDSDYRFCLINLPCDIQTEEICERAYPIKEKPSEQEKLLAHYAKLTIIHDKCLKGIATDTVNNAIWPESEKQGCSPQDVWEHIKDTCNSSEAQTDIRCSLNRVKMDLNQQRVDGILKHPALKPLADGKIMKVIFGDLEWPTEFDQYIIENPTDEGELIISQLAWLAKASAYILMRLKRWLEMGAEKEVKQFYKTYINPFAFQMNAINVTCGDLLDILPARLPTLEQRFREQYVKMLSVAEKADKERFSKLGECINSFKATSRDFHGTVFMIHSEAFIELKKLTQSASGKAGDTKKNTQKILGDKFNLWGLEINWRVLWDKLKKLMTNLKTFLHKDK